MRRVFAVFVVLMTACSQTAPTADSIPDAAPSSAVTTSQPPAASTTSPVPTTIDVPDTTAPPTTVVEQSLPEPPWTSVPTGLRGTSTVRLAHGSLGFLSVNYEERGAIVRLSSDGVSWAETAELRGPVGEEEFSIADMVVRKREYVIVGEIWSNIGNGNDSPRNALLRSADGITWGASYLDSLGEAASAVALLETTSGLVLTGATWADDTPWGRPKIWIDTGNGSWRDLTLGVDEFDTDAWVSGAFVENNGIVAWGLGTMGEAFVWRTEDMKTWTRSTVPGENIQRVAAMPGGFVAVGYSETWTSLDAIEWTIAATPDDLATDAVSRAWMWVRDVLVLDGYVVALVDVTDRSASSWCYLDLATCRKSSTTVLVSTDAKEWRRLVLPEDSNQNPKVADSTAMVVDGRLVVLHELAGDVGLSTLDAFENDRPLNTGASPNLPYAVIESGVATDIEVGVRYGYEVSAWCGWQPIGPINGTLWSVVSAIPLPDEVSAAPNRSILGFLELTSTGDLEYSLNDEVIAVFAPDAKPRTIGCF
ncbi:hypothetical protein MNBD_ACTINO02-1627 [hydrothermal vent metagenome]|uniref:Uncharacterized protein n=1 Tax=hydrothermal vent metagenome TaxID=652676 RepID=A0A3B0T864_9ZZZZ